MLQRKQDKAEDEAFARHVLQILLQGHDRIAAFATISVATLVLQVVLLLLLCVIVFHLAWVLPIIILEAKLAGYILLLLIIIIVVEVLSVELLGLLRVLICHHDVVIPFTVLGLLLSEGW